MDKKNLKISILGDGSWGTTLAILLQKAGYRVSLWGAFRDYVEILKKERINKKFLPGVKIPQSINISHHLQGVIEDALIITLAVPSQYLRLVLKDLNSYNLRNQIILNVSKGIENRSLMRMSEVVKDELGKCKYAVLSGPTIAREVLRGMPTAAVVASEDKKISELIQEIFMTDRFRLYTNDDVIGVELGGSFKNIIAIACGISDGLGFGTNTKAAIVSRGLAEMTRFGVALGAKKETFKGISGIGDLVTTCFSPYSRNRFVGEGIGRGNSIRQVLENMDAVAEGVPTAKSVYRLSLKYNIDMPITKEIYRVLYKNKSVKDIVDALMKRKRKAE